VVGWFRGDCFVLRRFCLWARQAALGVHIFVAFPSQTPDKRGAFNRSMQHHLIDVLFKDGVYERRETIETFSHAENRDLEPLEVRAVVA